MFFDLSIAFSPKSSRAHKVTSHEKFESNNNKIGTILRYIPYVHNAKRINSFDLSNVVIWH